MKPHCLNLALSVLISLFLGSGSWAADNLADRHTAKNIPCTACHGPEKPQPGALVENEQCLACHGPLDSLKQKFVSLGKKNPHDNHLGDIECSLCHMGHQPSRAYCLQCHKNFEMPMK